MKYSILSLLLISSCSSGKQLEALLGGTEKAICQNGKAVNGYSLTIMAYNDIKKGLRVEDAKDQTEELSTFYDFIAYSALPYLILNTELEVVDDGENRKKVVFAGTDIKEVDGRTWWSGGPGVGSIFERANLENPYKKTTRISEKFIPTSKNGDHLLICPEHSCLGLKTPIAGDEIIELDIYPNKGFGTAGNNVLTINNELSHHNELSNNLYLFDLISKSQIRIGNYFKKNYFVVPKMDQEKICTEMKSLNLGYPSGCFESGFKTSEDRGVYNQSSPEFKETYLSRSGAVFCGDKKTENESTDFSCDASESQRYMDAVVRDYILNKSFTVEKKNSGKWSIYKIKFDPSVMCKYSRDVNELTNN